MPAIRPPTVPPGTCRCDRGRQDGRQDGRQTQISRLGRASLDDDIVTCCALPRLRVSLSAAHSVRDVDALARAVQGCGCTPLQRLPFLEVQERLAPLEEQRQLPRVKGRLEELIEKDLGQSARHDGGQAGDRRSRL